MPNTSDYGVIVGIQIYPGLTNLGGPEYDACAFRDWVSSPTGGDVPEKNVSLILSSQFAAPTSADNAQPMLHDIEQAFSRLVDRAEDNDKARKGLRTGRRLYIYLAGHGIEPQAGQPALLMANAQPKRFGFHILGRAYAHYFYEAGFFDEILLFMDCCRDDYPAAAPMPVPFDRRTDPRAVDRVKCLYGFGTKWKRRTRERPIDGVVRGVFTTALLQGLSGGANDARNRITAASLRDYVNNVIRNLLAPGDLDDPSISLEADFEPIPNVGDGIVILQLAAAPTFEVEVVWPAGSAGQHAEVLGPDFASVATTVVDGAELDAALTKGIYLVQVLAAAKQARFEVKGLGGAVHVQL